MASISREISVPHCRRRMPFFAYSRSAGRFFPLLILMLLVFVPNCLPEMFQVEEARDYALIGLFAVLLLIYALVFGTFAYKYFRLKERLGK